MCASKTIRKLLTAMLALAIALWAEAGLALVDGDRVMQCSMTMHQIQGMGNMPCCPGNEAQSPATAPERPPCCSISNSPERPLAFVVSSQQGKAPTLDVVATVSAEIAAPVALPSALWRSADAPRFVKPVLELKSDFRI